ncbi:MAG TPA: tetratricopeptide repeat protein [Opitutaceae bacterium]|nr:tetratricopeptide repeat protein [Opitutaceae bacterium]
MIASPSSFFVRRFRPVAGLLALLAVLALPVAAAEQSQTDAEKKQLSDKIREGMTKYSAMQEAKQWPEAIALLTDLQKQAAPDTFDAFIVNYVKGQVYLTIDQQNAAIEPLETALRISDLHGFFDSKEEQKVLKFLYQLYYGAGSAKGTPVAKQEQAFIKSGEYAKRLIDEEREAHALNTDDVLFYAYLQLQRAQVNPEKIDQTLLKQAQKLSEEGLVLSINPNPQFYRLLLSTVLAEGDYPRAAEILEFLLKKDPTKKDDWTQLNAIYLNLGAEDKGDKQKAFDYNVRTILSFKRAQDHGFLKTSKDNFGLAATYYNIGQVEAAADLLSTDLKNGSIDSDQKYWTYAAQWYQQVDQQLKAIDVIKEAAKHFPNSGEFDYMAATNYYALEKYDDALQQARLAATKGLGEKTWQAWSFLAYTAFEVRKYDEALEAVTKALSYPDSKKDKQLPTFKEAVEKAIKDRNAQTEALNQKAKQQ